MTTIAYCNRVMACDSSITDDEGIQDGSQNKIVRLSSGALLGGSGDSDDRELVALFDKVKTPKQFPSRKALADLHMDYLGLLVLPNGRIYKIETVRAADGKPADG